MGVDVHYSGPVFDGGAGREVARFLDDAERMVADEGLQMLKSNLAPKLQHPTGRYMRSLTVVQTASHDEVTDGGVVYGPWLEGVGSRNARSRFKGYLHWRRTRQELAGRAGAIAERALPAHLDRMNRG